jgi:hypothetical protein
VDQAEGEVVDQAENAFEIAREPAA